MTNKKTTASGKNKQSTQKKETEEPKTKRYISVRAVMVHPFERVKIPMTPPGVQFDIEKDSWLQSQVNSGLIKCL